MPAAATISRPDKQQKRTLLGIGSEGSEEGFTQSPWGLRQPTITQGGIQHHSSPLMKPNQTLVDDKEQPGGAQGRVESGGDRRRSPGYPHGSPHWCWWLGLMSMRNGLYPRELSAYSKHAKGSLPMLLPWLLGCCWQWCRNGTFLLALGSRSHSLLSTGWGFSLKKKSV